MENVDGVLNTLTFYVTTYGLNVIGAIVILLIGLIIAGWVARIVENALARTQRVDETLRGFFSSFAKYFIIVFTVLAVLAQFGVQTASLIAIFGAAGLAIGLALQGTLSNLAAGVMLLLFRPFKTGDFIEAAGLSGTVKSITLFVTELATPDNVQIVVPNGQLWGASIHNYSFHDTRRVDLTLGIGYEANIADAKTAILDEVSKDARAHTEPAPMVAVLGLGDSSVDLVVRIWCKAGDYWALKFDLTEALKNRLDREGISIPYPQRAVHIVGAAGAASIPT
ncbi:mechanosensitive ion channel family protein [Algihabitans albus]|uniref:mechanosensitive ion channel family protein n=1 Tax=Algihabitans albus TaxID=2164067 RepID=UPI000E5C6318|nr:mechanosensitive ion channel domain-containing protein [Algihabitans albus]